MAVVGEMLIEIEQLLLVPNPQLVRMSAELAMVLKNKVRTAIFPQESLDMGHRLSCIY